MYYCMLREYSWIRVCISSKHTHLDREQGYIIYIFTECILKKDVLFDVERIQLDKGLHIFKTHTWIGNKDILYIFSQSASCRRMYYYILREYSWIRVCISSKHTHLDREQGYIIYIFTECILKKDVV